MLFHRLVGAVSVVACVLLQSQVAEAQVRGKRPMQRVQVSGKVHAVGLRGLQVVADNGARWIVEPPDKVEAITYTGKASVDWLRRGMFVRFASTFNQEFEAQEPVSELAVITIRPGVEPGIFPEGEPLAADNAQGEPQKRKRGNRGKAQNVVVPCLVIGQLYAVKDGQMTVATVRRTMAKATLAKDLAINVQMNDFRVAQSGDKVEFSGFVIPQQPGRVKARSINITAAKPLGAGKIKEGPGKGGKQKGKQADKRGK
jgi:hypothetical protein